MPFDPTTGIYTPPLGAENAMPGEVIRSATWNSIFTDIATALTQLAQKQLIQQPTIISNSSGYLVSTIDTLILVIGNTPGITLPDSTSKTSPVTIVGAATGIFSANNMTLFTQNSQLIDGLASGSIVLTTDYQSITLVPLASGGWVTI